MGLLLIWQFRADLSLSGAYPADEIEAREELFKSYLTEQGYLQSRILSLREEIENAQENIEIQSESSSLATLESLKKEIGLSEITGKGIEITLTDGPYAFRNGNKVQDEDLVQASDIRDIINVLNASNAEAISLNNQRIIATSPIVSVGNTILVNNSYITPPFVLNAVGDKDIILQRIANEPTIKPLIERNNRNQIDLKIVVRDFVSIPVYNGDLKTKYLTLIEQ